MTESLFRPIRMGALLLPHRIIMPALTRMRAQAGGVPGRLAAEYYGQRAGAALIISEGTAVSMQGHGYPSMPGMYSAAQRDGWCIITDAVHERGGRIALQLVHHGRWSHSSYNVDGALPVAPSAVTPPGMAFGPTFHTLPYETPRALTICEIGLIVETFRHASRRAMDAGFDAVEVQGGNGFLIDQFLHDGSNLRRDAYGGSIDRRARFLFEVLDGVAGDIGADRVGLRLSPHGSLGGLSDTDTEPHFRYVIRELNTRGLAWLHLVEPRASAVGLGDDASIDRANNVAMFREDASGPLIAAGGYSIDTAVEVISSGLADAVAFGRLFIANPDLVERIRRHTPLNVFDRATAYGGGAAGYTDYPFLAD